MNAWIVRRKCAVQRRNEKSQRKKSSPQTKDFKARRRRETQKDPSKKETYGEKEGRKKKTWYRARIKEPRRPTDATSLASTKK